MQRDVTSVVLRHRCPNGAFPADVVDKGADGLLALELSSCRATTGNRVVGCGCVWGA